MSITSEIGFDLDLEYEKFLINGWQWLDIVIYKKIPISCWSMPMVGDFQLWAVEVVIQLPRSILLYSNHVSNLQFSSVDLFLLSCHEYDYVVFSFTRLFFCALKHRARWSRLFFYETHWFGTWFQSAWRQILESPNLKPKQSQGFGGCEKKNLRTKNQSGFKKKRTIYLEWSESSESSHG